MPAPARTSLEEIVAAGRAALAESGPAGLTMQSVAQRVGVRAPSLYKHVADRDGLVRLVADAAADALAARLPRGPDIAALARTARAHAHEHPEEFRLLFGSTVSADANARVSAPVLEAARAAVGDEHALDAARLLTAWLVGFISMELAGAFRLGGDVEQAFEYGLRHVVGAL